MVSEGRGFPGRGGGLSRGECSGNASSSAFPRICGRRWTGKAHEDQSWWALVGALRN